MNHPEFGKVIAVQADVGKDAIHIACAPIILGEPMTCGTHVSLNGDGEAVKCSQNVSIGIIDPYLIQGQIFPKGCRVWLFLKPGTITGIRHEWSHPAFAIADKLSDKEKSIEWIKSWASEIGLGYGELMKAADNESYCWGDDNYPEWNEEFWQHYENVTGKRKAGNIFRCAC